MKNAKKAMTIQTNQGPKEVEYRTCGIRGLALTRNGETWTVTHVPSGKEIIGGFHLASTATWAAKKLAALARWTRSVADLRRSRRLHKKVQEILLFSVQREEKTRLASLGMILKESEGA